MDEHQVDMLRYLIKQEIEYAQQAESNFWNSFDLEKSNNEQWEEFKKSFQSINDNT